MAKNESSYQKLKRTKQAEIDALKHDIRCLRGKEGFQKKIEVVQRYNLQDETADAIWFTPITGKNNISQGFTVSKQRIKKPL